MRGKKTPFSIAKSILSFLLVACVLVTQTSLGAFAMEDVADSSVLEVGASEESGVGVYDEIITISTEQDLVDLAKRVNDGDKLANILVELVSNIKITQSSWDPIGNSAENPFSGVFDGKGHVVSGIKVSRSMNGGLFGYLYEAKITKLHITSPNAPNSTYGFFYAAEKSAIEFSNYENGVMNHSVSLRAFGVKMTSVWSGGMDSSWQNSSFPPSPGESYTIESADQFADFAYRIVETELDLVTNLPVIIADFEGVTIVLATDVDLSGHYWESPGDVLEETGFNGTFVGKVVDGGGTPRPAVIYGLNTDPTSDSSALFTFINDANISNIVIDGADVSATGAAYSNGIVVDGMASSTISNVIVRNSRITSDAMGVAAVVGDSNWLLSTNATASVIENVSVYKTTIENTGSSYASGVAGSISGTRISNVSVIDCDVIGDSAVGVLVEELAFPEYSAISNVLVYGNRLDGASESAGVLSSCMSGMSLMLSNIVVSNIETSSPSQYPISATDGITNLSYTFTEYQTASGELLPEDPTRGLDINNNYWDSMLNYTWPVDGSNGNAEYHSSELTKGSFVPNREYWIGSARSYPQLKAFANSTNEIERTFSGFAATAVVTVNAEEVYNDPAAPSKGMMLPHLTANGDEITWVIQQVSGVYTDEDVKDSAGIITHKLITTDSTAELDIKATIEVDGVVYSKTFQTAYVVDGVLREDITARVGSLDPSTAPTIAVDTPLILRYLENIEVNGDVAGVAELFEKTASGYASRQRIVVNAQDTGVFEVDSTTNTARTFFSLKPGVEYKIVFPEGIAREVVKGNLSEKVELYFNTISVHDPVIKLSDESENLSFTNKDRIELSQLLKHVTVFENSGDTTPIYEGTGSMSRLSASAWDSNVTSNRAAVSALKDKGEFPAGVTTYKYYLERESELLASLPAEGTFRMTIMVKNVDGNTAFASFTITITGDPTWVDGKMPKDHVHMPWTKSLDAVLSAARQGAMAVIVKEDGTNTPCIMELKYDKALWDKAAATNGEPSSVVISIVVYDATGSIADISQDVTVYLDKQIGYNLTPSPVLMNYSTERQIEERINFVGRNINSKEIKYEHNDNTYRKAGLYYIDVTSDPQFVTVCDDKSCADRPADRVQEEFIVQIQRTPGAETGTFWGDAAKEILDADFSREVLSLAPNSYLLPNYAVDALNTQKYGKISMEYFGEYRWNAYSTTLNTNYKWADTYSLQVTGVNEKAIEMMAGGNDKSVQFVFSNEGKLFGEVEFELNLSKARELHKNLPTKDLGLYRYNNHKDQLELVSHIQIDSTEVWGSAILRETLPTVYVLKETDPNDKLADDLTYYSKDGIIVYGNARAAVNPNYRQPMVDYDYVIDPDYSGRLFLDGTSAGDYTNLSDTLYDSGTNLLLPILITVVVASVLGLAVILLIRRRKSSERGNN